MDCLTLLLLRSIRYVGITSNSGTPKGQKENPFLRLNWQWKVVMGFGQASRRDSICTERTFKTGRWGYPSSDPGTPEMSSLREVEGQCWGLCKCPLGKVQGSSAANPGNPCHCSQSQSLMPVTALHPPVSRECCGRGIPP